METTIKKNIYGALADIQVKLNAPKGQYNSFGKYKYRSCEDILAAVKPLLTANDCTLTLSDDVVMVGNRTYIKATATLSIDGGESVSTTAYAREEEGKKGMDASQVTGAASSYARKYALNGLFAIDDMVDSDNGNNQPQGAVADKLASQQAQGVLALANAKTDAANIKNRDEFQAWWSKYPALQNNPEFLAVAQQLGKKFPKTK